MQPCRRAQRAQRHGRRGACRRVRASAKKPSSTALATFKSVKRRLEVRAEIDGITIIDDFAHHPTAIRETLRALRSVYPAGAPLGRPRAALQHAAPQSSRGGPGRQSAPGRSRRPRRRLSAAAHSRRRAAASGRRCPRSQRRRNAGRTASRRRRHRRLHRCRSLRSGDVVAILSNGGFDGIYEKLPARLEERHGVAR